MLFLIALGILDLFSMVVYSSVNSLANSLINKYLNGNRPLQIWLCSHLEEKEANNL